MALIKPTNPALSESVQPELVHGRAALIGQLDASAPEARRSAARDLAQYPRISGVLAERLQREADPSVREAILGTLTLCGDTEAVACLVACLRSESAALRNEAIQAMKRLAAQVAPIMGGLLVDPDPDVRIFAVNILESLRHPDVEGWLLGVIDRDDALNVCATAVDLLGELGTAAACPSLQRLKARFPDEPYVQFAADLALARISEG